MRARLDGLRGRQYWRSLEELAETPEFRRVVEREFPRRPPNGSTGRARRQFLQLMGASLALAGRDGVHASARRAARAVREDAGEHGAGTAAVLRDGDATGRVRRSGSWSRATRAGRRRSRATRIIRPASVRPMPSRRPRCCSSTIPIARRRSPISARSVRGRRSSRRMRNALSEREALQGAGLRILTESVTSPTLAEQLADITTALPQAKLAPVRTGQRRPRAGRRRDRASARRCARTIASSAPQVVVSLDADVFGSGAGSVRYARDFANGRRVRKAKADGDEPAVRRRSR